MAECEEKFKLAAILLTALKAVGKTNEWPDARNERHKTRRDVWEEMEVDGRMCSMWKRGGGG